MDIESAPPALKGSLQDRIRQTVEAEIVAGLRLPGSAIDDRELAERFQASRTPVREALLMLAAQGLVHIAPRSGIYVRRASIGELVSKLEAVMELESILAGMASQRATAAQRDELRVALAAASARADARDLRGYDVANLMLHDVIYRASGNPVLVDTVRNMRIALAAYRQRSTHHPGRLQASDAEHKRVVAAICAGDAAEAAAQMRQHINFGGEAMVRLVMAAQAMGARDETAIVTVPVAPAPPLLAPKTPTAPRAAVKTPRRART